VCRTGEAMMFQTVDENTSADPKHRGGADGRQEPQKHGRACEPACKVDPLGGVTGVQN
jgi:hypothetical protein